MSKSIKVSDTILEEIHELQKPRESISEVLERVIAAYKTIQGIRDGLPASHYLQERPKQEVKSEV